MIGPIPRRELPLWALACAVFLHCLALAALDLADRLNAPEDFSAPIEIPVEMVDTEKTPPQEGAEEPRSSAGPRELPSRDAQSSGADAPRNGTAGRGLVLERPSVTDLPDKPGARGSRNPDRTATGIDKRDMPFGGLAPLQAEAETPKGPTFLTGDVMQPRKPAQSNTDNNNDNYRAKVLQQVQDAMIDPGRPRPKAVALVAFAVDDKGGLAAVTLAKASGHPDLDAEAMDMVRRAAPFPPPPPGAERRLGAFIEFGAE